MVGRAISLVHVLYRAWTPCSLWRWVTGALFCSAARRQYWSYPQVPGQAVRAEQ